MTPLFPYQWNGKDGLANLPTFTKFLGRKPEGVTDFVAFDSWSSFESDGAWACGAWKGQGLRLHLSVPLTVKGTSLADVAAGKHDASFLKVAKAAAATDPAAYIRLGWEMNGGWYPWAHKGHEADYKAAYRHVVGLFRSVSSAFRIVWCCAQGMQQQWPDASWPGDDVVDVVGMDVYNQSWVAPVSDKAKLWNDVLNGSWGVAQLVKFAKQHGKPYAFPEIGTGDRPDGHGGGDDPTFWTNMAPIIAGAEFIGPWDVNAGDYNSRMSHGERPQSAAAFLKLFATPTPAQPAAPVPPLTAKVTTGTGSVVVTPNADGSSWLALSFPTGGHHRVTISAKRQIGFSPTSIWFSATGFDWDSAGTGKVWVGAK